MGLLNWMFRKKNEPEQSGILRQDSPKFTAIGNTEPICPYCNFKLNKMPLKKKQCPKCGNFIRSRTRPLDNEKVLIKENQMNELDAQWAIKNEHQSSVLGKHVTPKQHFISSDEIQRILDKPWSEVTIVDRKKICNSDITIRVPKEVKRRLLQEGADGISRISEETLRAEVELEKKKGIFPTLTWVIPPEGCPIEAHKFLDGVKVDVGEQWEIPNAEWKGYKTFQPKGFGEPALDNNCRCWVVAGVRKKI